MKEYFKQQFEYANPITQDLLDELPQKNYTSGEEKQVGDIPLWGFKANFEIKNYEEELELNLFSLCEREFPFYLDQYTIIRNPLSGQLDMPIFIKKGEEDKFNSMKNDHLKN
jgi:hypothetical protein